MMGICYQGKTLAEVVDQRDTSFKESGYAYGLKELSLLDEDPAKFMRFQMRLVASCINARETAKLISANPMSIIQGELLFMLANAEGDVISTSYGLAGHIQCMPYIIKSIAELNFEDDPGINPGDIFSVNDALYGPAHNADCYTFLPIYHENELVGWTVGLNHIVDVGGIQPGGLGTISPSVFTDGFTYPPTKTGHNFKQEKWWDLHWKRRTRTEMFNVLDDKMRAAGIVSLHHMIQEVIEEFGVDYYRQAMKEIIERERRLMINRLKTMAVPGHYNWLQFKSVDYKDNLGRLWPASNRNWILHKPAELTVRTDGTLFTDMEGLTSEGEFHCNAYPSAVRMLTSLGIWPMFAYTETLNTALQYMTDWNLPPGSMFNPQNPWAATVMGLAEVGAVAYHYLRCLSYAYFSRGFLEETYPQDGAGCGYGVQGMLGDGFQWAGGDMALITCWGQGGKAFADGFEAAWCGPNPEPDQGEVELSEFLQPTQLNIGRNMITDFCGHGKYRSGLEIGMMQMINQPGQALIIATFSGTSGMGGAALGMCGGYPRSNDVIIYAHDTNIREVIDQGGHYPRDFVEMRQMIDDGTLKVGNMELFNCPTPSIPCGDGDLFASTSGSMGGWGDALERDYGLIEKDVKYGWISPECAKTVYGTVTDDSGKVDSQASDALREQMRNRRKERSVDAKEWWKQERQVVIDKKWHEDMHAMFVDNCKYEKFRNEFMGMWQLPEEYTF
ncbi:MAG: hydantoinase B/oxoprolinase family protein [Chloroflexi bacterium]|nr:hydantoinase B/oxoprolinase family protein [Chloroflexota bacterium]